MIQRQQTTEIPHLNTAFNVFHLRKIILGYRSVVIVPKNIVKFLMDLCLYVRIFGKETQRPRNA